MLRQSLSHFVGHIDRGSLDVHLGSSNRRIRTLW